MILTGELGKIDKLQNKVSFVERFLALSTGISKDFPKIMKSVAVLTYDIHTTPFPTSMDKETHVGIIYKTLMVNVYDVLSSKKTNTLLSSLFKEAIKSAEENSKIYEEGHFTMDMADKIEHMWIDHREEFERELFQI